MFQYTYTVHNIYVGMNLLSHAFIISFAWGEYCVCWYVCVHMYKGQRIVLVSFLRYPPIAVGAPSVLSANNL